MTASSASIARGETHAAGLRTACVGRCPAPEGLHREEARLRHAPVAGGLHRAAVVQHRVHEQLVVAHVDRLV
eukprot:7452170-Heterocapsa_arctica.AAC.1